MSGQAIAARLWGRSKSPIWSKENVKTLMFLQNISVLVRWFFNIYIKVKRTYFGSRVLIVSERIFKGRNRKKLWSINIFYRHHITFKEVTATSALQVKVNKLENEVYFMAIAAGCLPASSLINTVSSSKVKENKNQQWTRSVRKQKQMKMCSILPGVNP